jgi:hypothetical protein
MDGIDTDMSAESTETADLVPYLLVDERARGLFLHVARSCSGHQ